MKPRRSLPLALAAVGALVLCQSFPVAHAQSTEAELLKTVVVPENFEATIFAMPPAVNYPTFVKATPEGIVYVSQDKNGSLAREPNRGAILQCLDTDGDGKADQVNQFVASVDSPRGLEWDGEWLYCLHPPHLSRYRDNDGDGSADEEEVLVEGIAFGFEDRPADHTSNGITLGIDGWLYCAIGDFGFMNARGTDGAEVQFRGGGVVRVRRDGTGMHIFSRGTRNIYEVAVGPTLEAYTRDNTNDGGGWDVRLHHFTGLDHHGYPSLYRNFPEEIIQPLREYGGGSGVGSVWIDEPGYPEPYQNIPCTVDWGPGWVYAHKLSKKGATFQEDEQIEFIKTPRSTDATIDAGGRIFVSSWKDGRFKYEGEHIGYVAMVQPKGHQKRPVPEFAKATDAELASMIGDESFTLRKAAQWELLRRGLDAETRNILISIATRSDSERIAAAAIFTLALGGDEAIPISFWADVLKQYPEVATRALAEIGKPMDDPSIEIVANDPAVRLEIVRWLAATEDGADTLITMTEDEDPIVAHAAVNALVETNAVDACLSTFLRNPTVHRALQQMHSPVVVERLISELEIQLDAASSSSSSAGRENATAILKTLARLYYREGEWKGESWGTRPDTSGPYYKRVTWEMSETIAEKLRSALVHENTNKAALIAEISRNQIDLNDSIPTVLKLAEKDPVLEKSLVDLVLKKSETPADAIPALIRVATSIDRQGELRLDAARALARGRDPYGFEVAFDLAVRRDEFDAIPHVKNWLREAISQSPEIENQYEMLVEVAHGEDDKAGRMAFGVLVKLLDRKPLAPETRGEIQTALEETQLESNPDHLIRLLRAIAETKHRNSKAIVIAAASRPEPGVVKAAQSAAKSLRIDLDAASKPKGALIGSIEPITVLGQVAKIKGDKELGEALFSQQTCAICHTMKSDEALKGPYLGNIAGIYQGRDLAEAILN
ncbi:MAG: heme-binding protein, partial [Verrucomicrobiota bacterium]